MAGAHTSTRLMSPNNNIDFSHSPCVPQFLQIFFADSKFSRYKDNNFALWTES